MKKQVNYFREKIFASLAEYAGLVAGVSGAIQIFQSGYNGEKLGLIISGGGTYCFGKTINMMINRAILRDELTQRGLEEKVSKK